MTLRHFEVVHGDSLGAITRKERRNVLVTSALVIVLTSGSLVPTRIDALGLQFEDLNSSGLLIALAAVLLYQLSAFVVYAGNDWYSSTYQARLLGPDKLRRLCADSDRLAAEISAVIEGTIPAGSPTTRSRTASLLERMHEIRDELSDMEQEGAVLDYRSRGTWPRVGFIVGRWAFDFFAPVPVAVAALWSIFGAL